MKRRKKRSGKPVFSILVGKCRHCTKDVWSDTSFVAFADKTYAHYDCMKKDDDERQCNIKSAEKKI